MSTAEYQVKSKERHLYHLRLTRIIKDGKRTKDLNYYQSMTKKELLVFQRHVNEHGLAATGYDEYEIVYDPSEKEVKQRGAPKGETSQKKD